MERLTSEMKELVMKMTVTQTAFFFFFLKKDAPTSLNCSSPPRVTRKKRPSLRLGGIFRNFCKCPPDLRNTKREKEHVLLTRRRASEFGTSRSRVRLGLGHLAPPASEPRLPAGRVL